MAKNNNSNNFKNIRGTMSYDDMRVSSYGSGGFIPSIKTSFRMEDDFRASETLDNQISDLQKRVITGKLKNNPEALNLFNNIIKNKAEVVSDFEEGNPTASAYRYTDKYAGTITRAIDRGIDAVKNDIFSRERIRKSEQEEAARLEKLYNEHNKLKELYQKETGEELNLITEAKIARQNTQQQLSIYNENGVISTFAGSFVGGTFGAVKNVADEGDILGAALILSPFGRIKTMHTALSNGVRVAATAAVTNSLYEAWNMGDEANYFTGVLDEEYTNTDYATDIAFAGIFGGVLEGGGAYIGSRTYNKYKNVNVENVVNEILEEEGGLITETDIAEGNADAQISRETDKQNTENKTNYIEKGKREINSIFKIQNKKLKRINKDIDKDVKELEKNIDEDNNSFSNNNELVEQEYNNQNILENDYRNSQIQEEIDNEIDPELEKLKLEKEENEKSAKDLAFVEKESSALSSKFEAEELKTEVEKLDTTIKDFKLKRNTELKVVENEIKNIKKEKKKELSVLDKDLNKTLTERNKIVKTDNDNKKILPEINKTIEDINKKIKSNNSSNKKLSSDLNKSLKEREKLIKSNNKENKKLLSELDKNIAKRDKILKSNKDNKKLLSDLDKRVKTLNKEIEQKTNTYDQKIEDLEYKYKDKEADFKITENDYTSKRNSLNDFLKTKSKEGKRVSKKDYNPSSTNENVANKFLKLKTLKMAKDKKSLKNISRESYVENEDLGYTNRDIDLEINSLNKRKEELKKEAEELVLSEDVPMVKDFTEKKSKRDKSISENNKIDKAIKKDIKDNNTEIREFSDKNINTLRDINSVEEFNNRVNFKELNAQLLKLRDKIVDKIENTKFNKDFYIEEFNLVKQKLEELSNREFPKNATNKKDAFINKELIKRFGYKNLEDYEANIDSFINNRKSKYKDLAKAQYQKSINELMSIRNNIIRQEQLKLMDSYKNKSVDEIRKGKDIKENIEKLKNFIKETTPNVKSKDLFGDIKEKVDSDRILATDEVNMSIDTLRVLSRIEEMLDSMNIPQANTPARRDLIAAQLQKKVEDITYNVHPENNNLLKKLFREVIFDRSIDTEIEKLSNTVSKKNGKDFINKHREKIEQLIKDGATYEQIIKQFKDSAYNYNKRFSDITENAILKDREKLNKVKISDKINKDDYSDADKEILEEYEKIVNSDKSIKDELIDVYDEETGEIIQMSYKEKMKKEEQETQELKDATTCMLK